MKFTDTSVSAVRVILTRLGLQTKLGETLGLGGCVKIEECSQG
jgi:hypothetical protein